MKHETKHTAGPWSVLDEENRTYVIDAEDCTVAIIPMDRTPGNTERADAALISAAPEMLEALELAVAKLCPLPSFEQLDPNLEEDAAILKMLSAIAKAKGGAE